MRLALRVPGIAVDAGAHLLAVGGAHAQHDPAKLSSHALRGALTTLPLKGFTAETAQMFHPR